MIDVSSFAHKWGLVDHSLKSTWTWESILALINDEQNRGSIRYLGAGGFTLGGLEKEVYCKSVLDYLQPLAPNHYVRASVYASLTAQSKSFPLHSDPGQHVWIWQLLGETPWRVDNSELTLMPGQLLYITPSTPHCALPNQPRASISFSLEQFD